MTLPTKVNGHSIDPPAPPPVVVTVKEPTAIVDYLRPNGFPEKAARLEEDEKGNAKLRLFGLSGTVIVKDVPFSAVKRRGCWSRLGAKGRVA